MQKFSVVRKIYKRCNSEKLIQLKRKPRQLLFSKVKRNNLNNFESFIYSVNFHYLNIFSHQTDLARRKKEKKNRTDN